MRLQGVSPGATWAVQVLVQRDTAMLRGQTTLSGRGRAGGLGRPLPAYRRQLLGLPSSVTRPGELVPPASVRGCPPPAEYPLPLSPIPGPRWVLGPQAKASSSHPGQSPVAPWPQGSSDFQAGPFSGAPSQVPA